MWRHINLGRCLGTGTGCGCGRGCRGSHGDGARGHGRCRLHLDIATGPVIQRSVCMPYKTSCQPFVSTYVRTYVHALTAMHCRAGCRPVSRTAHRHPAPSYTRRMTNTPDGTRCLGHPALTQSTRTCMHSAQTFCISDAWIGRAHLWHGGPLSALRVGLRATAPRAGAGRGGGARAPGGSGLGGGASTGCVCGVIRHGCVWAVIVPWTGAGRSWRPRCRHCPCADTPLCCSTAVCVM